MPVSYSQIVGDDIGRLANLSVDSIFGVGMTWLILEVRLRAGYIATSGSYGTACSRWARGFWSIS